MNCKKILIALFIMAVLFILTHFGNDKLLTFFIPFVFAHCDTMDGPVIKDARKALETKNVNIILKWVQKKDEEEIKKAFEKTLSVRKLNPQAEDLADMYFFETLVRIHRAGEGAPYTGIKPAGSEVEPGIAAADKAVESGTVEKLAGEVSEYIARSIEERFATLMEKKRHKDESVHAGREYVEAYVTFIHYIEKLHQIASHQGGHYEEPTMEKQDEH